MTRLLFLFPVACAVSAAPFAAAAAADARALATVVVTATRVPAPLAEVPGVASAMLMVPVHAIIHIPVSSVSGQAVLTMPIMAPLAEFAGSSRHLIVTAYQSANGFVNLVNPTFAVVMGGLAIGRVGYDRWLKFVAPLLLLLVIIISAVLSIGAI